MVNVGTGTAGTRFLNKDWPITEGLTAGTNKQDENKMFLEATEESLVLDRNKAGVR